MITHTQLDRDTLIDLWAKRLRASTDFECGYYQGRFEEHASQTDIHPDDFPEIQEAARLSTIAMWRTPSSSTKPKLRQAQNERA